MTTLDNLTTYLKYDDIFEIYEDNDVDYDEGVLTISWDCKFDKEKEEFVNKELNDLMSNEHHFKVENGKANFMWLEKIKKKCNYEIGDEIYIFTKTNCDGFFNCYYTKNKYLHNCQKYHNMYIDKRGFVNVEQYVYPYLNYQQYQTEYNDMAIASYFVRHTCLYNDMINKNK